MTQFNFEWLYWPLTLSLGKIHCALIISIGTTCQFSNHVLTKNDRWEFIIFHILFLKAKQQFFSLIWYLSLDLLKMSFSRKWIFIFSTKLELTSIKNTNELLVSESNFRGAFLSYKFGLFYKLRLLLIEFEKCWCLKLRKIITSEISFQI